MPKWIKLVFLWFVLFGVVVIARKTTAHYLDGSAHPLASKPDGPEYALRLESRLGAITFEDFMAKEPKLAEEISTALDNRLRDLLPPCGPLAMRDSGHQRVEYAMAIALANRGPADAIIDHVSFEASTPPLSTVTRRCLEERVAMVRSIKVSGNVGPDEILYRLCFTPAYQSRN